MAYKRIVAAGHVPVSCPARRLLSEVIFKGIYIVVPVDDMFIGSLDVVMCLQLKVVEVRDDAFGPLLNFIPRRRVVLLCQGRLLQLESRH